MNKSNTYKELGKLFREIGNIYMKYGDLELAPEEMEREDVIRAINILCNKYDIEHIMMIKDNFLHSPFKVTDAAKQLKEA